MPELFTRRGLLSLAGAAGAATLLGVPAAAPALAAPRITLGAYTAGMDAYPSRLSALAITLGQPLGIASVFRGDGDVWPGSIEAALAAGRTLLVSWHLDFRSYGYWASTSSTSYLAAVAKRVKAYGRPVAIRPWAEMNGDWQPFQPTARPTDGYPTGYAAFVAAWRHVVSVFRAQGVTRLRTMVDRRDTLILSFFRAQGMRAGPSLQLDLDLEAAP